MVEATSNTAYPLKENPLSQGHEMKLTSLSNSFLIHCQEFSPNLHIFRAKDYTHDLLCEMTLEVKELFAPSEEGNEEETHLTMVTACNFPSFNLQKLNEKIGFDPYLQRLLTGQFQLKALEKLLLFCEEENAIKLILTVNNVDRDALEIYSRFFIAEKQVTTDKGKMTETVIRADRETYNNVIDFMDKIDREFWCALGRGQSINPLFQAYLKLNACL
jgi:hypothetical protein